MSLLQFVPRTPANEADFKLADMFLEFVKNDKSIFSDPDVYNRVQSEINRLRSEVAAALSKTELEKKAREQQEKDRLAQVEKDRLAQVEKDRLAQVEKDRLAQVEKDRLAQVEKDRLAQVEKDRLAQVEKDRLAQVEKDRLAQVEKDRLAQVEKDRLAQVEKDRLASILAASKKTNETISFKTLYKSNESSITKALSVFESNNGLDATLIKETKSRLESPTSLKDTLKALYTLQPSF